MMCIQSPGLIVFAFLIAIRRGTEWYNSITYLSAGILQSVLLVMCIIWKIREMREDTGGAVVLRDETAALLEDVRGVVINYHLKRDTSSLMLTQTGGIINQAIELNPSCRDMKHSGHTAGWNWWGIIHQGSNPYYKSIST